MENISVVSASQFSPSVQISKPLFISTENDWRLKTLGTVLSMARLPKGNESWRLKRPLPEARLNALRLVETLITAHDLHDIPAPFVAPTACEGIQFEWACRHREVEIEISPDGSVSVLKLESQKPIQEDSIASISDFTLRPFFDWLLSSPKE